MKLPSPQLELIALQGGLDQVTPVLSLPPGFIRRGANFECGINGGMTRIAGYERFDGHTNPSEAAYLVLTCALSATVAVGDVVTGVTSTAYGTVVLVDGGTVVVTKVTGDYTFAGENLTVSGSPVGSLTTYTSLASDAADDVYYTWLAAEEYRSDISAVTGDGQIRGVEYYNGTVYAWRNNVGNTALGLYKSTASGWSAVTLGKELSFSAGSAAIVEGNTVVGATSAATGVVARVVLESGTWGAGTAAGRLILSSTTGTFVSETLNVSAAPKATTSGGATQITLSPSGRVQTVVANFGGGVNNRRIYGCDGVNRAFEFDGTTYVPLRSGMTVDTPQCIAVHKNHLFLAFTSSLQFSSVNNPYVFSVVTGAGELALNDTITMLQPLPGDQTSGAMAVHTESETSILYGYSQSTFALSQFNIEAGAYPYTGANLDQAYFLGRQGVAGLGATLNFGNFSSSALTMKIRPFMQSRREIATASLSNNEKGQYRLFFSDGYGIYLTMNNGQFVGVMPVQFNNPVMCACNGEIADDGTEVHYFGSDDGFVYRLDAGTSFDGDIIPAAMALNFSSGRSSRQFKGYLKASIELTGNGYVSFDFGYQLGYGTAALEQPGTTSETSDLRSAYWDDFTWDEFMWDGRGVAPNEIPLYGSGENIAMLVSCDSAYLKPFTLNSIILHSMPRRGLR